MKGVNNLNAIILHVQFSQHISRKGYIFPEVCFCYFCQRLGRGKCMGLFQSPLFYPIGLIICFYVLSLLAWLFGMILDKTLW